jgi:hypothetical protein
MNWRKLGIIALLVCLLGVAIYQSIPIIRDTGIPYLKAAWRTRELTGMEKSARFLLGSEGAAYVRFIQETVPEDYQVVIPERVYNSLREQSVMQFFFIPRDIPSCGCEDVSTQEAYDGCLQCLQIPNNAVPAIGKYPPVEPSRLNKVFVPFEGVSDYFFGVYLDKPIGEDQVRAVSGFSQPVILVLLLDLFLLFVLFAIGFLITTLTLDPPSWADGISLGFPLGAGFSTLLVFLLGWAEFSIQLPLVVTTIFILLFSLIGLNYLRHGSLSFTRILGPIHISSETKKPIPIALSIGFSILFLILVITSLTRAYSLFDGIANWALKGYAIAEFSSIFAGQHWGGHGLSYPQNIHLLVAFFRLLDGDLLPGSKLIFPFFSLSLLLGCFTFWRRNSVPTSIAIVGMLLLITTPFFFWHSSIGWSNLIFSAYIVLGSLWTIDGGVNGDKCKVLLAGVCLGFAGWTRVEGGGFALIVLSAIFIGLALIKTWQPKYLLAYIPVLIIAVIWGAFGAKYVAGDEIGRVLQKAYEAFRTGEFGLSSLNFVLRFAADKFESTRNWGLMIYLLPVLLIIGSITMSRHKIVRAVPLFAAAIASLTVPIGMFYLAAFDKGDSRLFLNVSFDRAMIPGVVLSLVFVLLIATSNLVPEHQPRKEPTQESD